MNDRRCFWLASMYNLIPRLFQEKVDGMYLPPAREGKSRCPLKKEFEDSTNIVKSGTQEVNEGQISTVKR